MNYILVGHKPISTDLMTWARWFTTSNRQVAVDDIGEAHISTVFIGLDHSFGDGPPLLFETMIFGGPHANYEERCSTWEQAEAMHARAVAVVRGGVDSTEQQP